MGKWRRYSVGKYRLQQLNGRAHVVWIDEQGRRQRRVLGASDEVAGRAELDAFAKSVSILRARQATTIGELYAAYAADRPIHYRDVLSTIYHNVGIDSSTYIRDMAERPVRILPEEARPIRELTGNS